MNSKACSAWLFIGLVKQLPLHKFSHFAQGSSWTLQAEQMDGDLGSLGTLRSDQIQVSLFNY